MLLKLNDMRGGVLRGKQAYLQALQDTNEPAREVRMEAYKNMKREID